MRVLVINQKEAGTTDMLVMFLAHLGFVSAGFEFNPGPDNPIIHYGDETVWKPLVLVNATLQADVFFVGHSSAIRRIIEVGRDNRTITHQAVFGISTDPEQDYVARRFNISDLVKNGGALLKQVLNEYRSGRDSA